MMDSKTFGQIALELFKGAQIPGTAFDVMLQFRGYAEALSKGSAVIADVQTEPEPAPTEQ